METWRQRRILTPVTPSAWITATYLKRFWRAFFLLIVIFASTEHLAFSQPWVRVIKEVAVIRRQNEADARKRDLRTNWRTAVKVAVADLANINVRAANVRPLQMQAYAKAFQYIQSDRVLWDDPDATHQLYRVGLEVEVAMERLAQKLIGLRLNPPKRHIPRRLVLLTMRQPAQTGGSPAGDLTRTMAQGLRHAFQGPSLRLINGDTAIPWDQQAMSALKRAQAVQANLVLGGWVEVESPPEEVAGHSHTALATVDVAFWDAMTQGQLAHEHAQVMMRGANSTRMAQDAVMRAAMQVVARPHR